MSPRPRKVSDEEVFAAAHRAMTRLGPGELTLAEIAAEAGVTAGALSQRFGSKRQLLLALAEGAAVGTGDFIRELRSAHRSPLAALRAYAECMADLARSPAALARNLAYLEIDLADPEFHAHVAAQARATRAGLEELLEEAVAAGELTRGTDVRALARTVEVVLNGSLVTWAFYQDGTAARWLRDNVDAVLAPPQAGATFDSSFGGRVLPQVDAMESDHGIQELISGADAGDARAAEQLFAALYGELHRLAEHHLRRGGSSLTLGPTTLLHEAYLNVAGRGDVAFADRSRFLAYASRAMRGLLIDYARRRRAQKRGRQVEITLSEDAQPSAGAMRQAEELERLGDALDELAALEPALAELVDLRFFCGFSFGEIAEIRRVSERTVQRDWRKARLLLHHAMLEEGEAAEGER